MDEQSATSILMEVMEEFGDAEPEDFLAIWTNKSGEIVIKSNCRKARALGLAAYADKWISQEAGF